MCDMCIVCHIVLCHVVCCHIVLCRELMHGVCHELHELLGPQLGMTEEQLFHAVTQVGQARVG